MVMFRCACVLTTAIVFGLAMAAAFAQPPLTSDSSKARVLPPTNPGIYPGRAAVYVQPVDDIVVVFCTNERPILVEITITSNVVRRVRWWNNGVPATNDSILSSNLVSRTTNMVDASR